MEMSKFNILINFHHDNINKYFINKQVCYSDIEYDTWEVNLIPKKSTIIKLTLEGNGDNIILEIDEKHLLYWNISAHYTGRESEINNFQINAVGYIKGVPFHIREVSEDCFNKIRIYNQKMSIDEKYTVKEIIAKGQLSNKYVTFLDNYITFDQLAMENMEEKREMVYGLF